MSYATSGMTGATRSRRTLMNNLGPVVYAARLADGTIKIGWTQHLHDRLRFLSSHVSQKVDLLAFRPGSNEDEQDIHLSLRAYRVDTRWEYYNPTDEVLAVVNDMRATLNMSPVAA